MHHSLEISFRESRAIVKKMEWTIPLIFFDPLPNSFELSFFIKIIFSIISIFIIILGLLVHRRILSFLKNNDERHVDQIIAYQSRVNCFLIPISLSWLMGLQWFGEMQQFVSPQGCYIGSFLGMYITIASILYINSFQLLGQFCIPHCGKF